MTDNKWYQKSGDQGDIVISTRIRLARNLTNIPFPSKLNNQQRDEVNNKIRTAFFSIGEYAKDFDYIDLSDVSTSQVNSYVEHHLISPECANDTTSKAIIINKDNSVCIMLCEEDHLRIQVMSSGMSFEDAFDTADKLDSLLSEKLDFAFNERLGFLTECPTNLGTGMRASVMLHLPTLEAKNNIQRLANSVSKIGLTLRGTYGEGSKPIGSMYQLSNQITLGINEKDALENLKSITAQVIESEKKARQTLDTILIEDNAYRSLAILKNARLMSSSEMISLISNIRLGISQGLISNITIEKINTIYNKMLPSTFLLENGKIENANQRDILRAKAIRQELDNI